MEILKAMELALDAVTPGEWDVWPDFDSDGETGNYCVGQREAPSLVTCCEGSERDAHLIALLKNNASLLIEAVKALEAARWALMACADQASDLAELHSGVNDLWNEGGEAYEGAHKVRNALDKLCQCAVI